MGHESNTSTWNMNYEQTAIGRQIDFETMNSTNSTTPTSPSAICFKVNNLIESTFTSTFTSNFLYLKKNYLNSFYYIINNAQNHITSNKSSDRMIPLQVVFFLSFNFLSCIDLVRAIACSNLEKTILRHNKIKI